PPAALALDAPQDGKILRLGVRVVRRHDAAVTKRRNVDDRLADPEALARPRPLGVGRRATDQDVRAEPPPVQTERRDGAVGRDQERQHVETLGPVEARQPNVRPDGLSNPRGDDLRAPWLTIDERLAVVAETRPKAQQGRVAACRQDPTVVVRVNDAIAWNSVRRQRGDLELLTSPLFDG